MSIFKTEMEVNFWKFLQQEMELLQNALADLETSSKSKPNPGKPKKKIICMQSLKEYDSIADAARDLGLNVGNISAHLAGRIRHVKGYTFKLIESENDDEN